MKTSRSRRVRKSAGRDSNLIQRPVRRHLSVERLELRALMAGLELSVVGSYFAPGNATTEIAAYDPASQRVFYTSATSNALGIVSISNPAAPNEITLIDLAPYGGGPNSVAVKNDIVAVAVEATVKTDAGKVLFFNADGILLGQVTVGALPDMLTFTPDGQKILVANEGEPNSYSQADSVDPVGSVSIIDLTGGVAGAVVTHVSFAGYNGQEAALRAQGIRIFGPDDSDADALPASAAQDFEPEYITTDGTTAWVTLQENNALATIDIAAALANPTYLPPLAPLGLKDHSATLDTYTFDLSAESAGTTAVGQNVPFGGFSGLFFEGYTPTGKLKFIANTDRGPNGEPSGQNRPFMVPAFNPTLVRFELNPTTGQLSITQKIGLKDKNGVSLTGLPNINRTATPAEAGLTAEQLPNNDEVAVDLTGVSLANGLDPLGGDFEGIVVDPDGTFWLCDEYRPAIYHFDATGKLIDRFVPIGTHAAANEPYTAGTFGKYGTEALPAVLGQRRQNRGFEAISLHAGKLYAFVQSPTRNPSSQANGALNAQTNVRLVEFDPVTKATRQFIYQMDNLATTGTDTRADKIGDMLSVGNGDFLVVERDDDASGSDPAAAIQKKIYRFNLTNATDVSAITTVNGKTPDQMTAAELTTAGITAVRKALHVDLNTVGYNTVEKVEGLALVDAHTLAVVNDNDFGVGGTPINPAGTFTPTGVPTILGLITLPQGLDASDQDGMINIAPQPVMGMYQPDAIAHYKVGGQTYLVTANEGDAREYAGLLGGATAALQSEEIRVGNNLYELDTTVFPNATTLKQNNNLGRLNASRFTGNTDADAQFEQIHAFGSRSFSIRDAAGNLVWDSGDDFERITAAEYPAFFNASNADNTFDSRSDNKGPEPEAAMVAQIAGRTYAFIGLERIGGIMVYDVTNPQHPTFVQYINNRDFTQAATTAAITDLGVEDLKFIPADESPTGTPLVMSVNEISGSLTLFAVNLASGVRLTDQGVLEIIGTTGNDQVRISRDGNQLRVLASFLSPPTTTFSVTDIGSIHAILGAGDDLAIVERQVVFPLVLEGWAGNDRLTAGGGVATVLGGIGNDALTATWAATVLVGGDGSDLLVGGRGRSVLFGGAGSDLLYAGSNQDILIGGETRYDTDLVALAAIRDSWNGPGSFFARKQALQDGITTPHGKVKIVAGETVLDDGAVDLLLGGSGQDWLLKFFGDFGL